MGEKTGVPDHVRQVTNPHTVIQHLKEADEVDVWDLPMEYNTLQQVASMSGIEFQPNTSQGVLEEKIADHYTEQE